MTTPEHKEPDNWKEGDTLDINYWANIIAAEEAHQAAIKAKIFNAGNPDIVAAQTRGLQAILLESESLKKDLPADQK